MNIEFVKSTSINITGIKISFELLDNTIVETLPYTPSSVAEKGIKNMLIKIEGNNTASITFLEIIKTDTVADDFMQSKT